MRRTLVALSVLLIATSMPLVVSAKTPSEAPEAMTLDDCMNKRSAVEFPHAAHFELAECVTCHHTQEGLSAEADMEVETCGSCHNEPEAAETPKCSEMSLSKNHFHINCVSCHKESGSENAPTKCDECHPKAEG